MALDSTVKAEPAVTTTVLERRFESLFPRVVLFEYQRQALQDWSRFVDRFGMPLPARHRSTRYWQRREAFRRRQAKKKYAAAVIHDECRSAMVDADVAALQAHLAEAQANGEEI